MKCEELQIGSFVNVWPSLMTIRVEAIHHKKVGYHTCTHKLDWIRQGLLRPIPLTDEILEKNGFQYNKEETEGDIQSVYRHYTKFFDFPLGKGFYIEHDTVCDEFYITDHTWIRFKYVHEFQKVLRMCNIEEKLVL